MRKLCKVLMALPLLFVSVYYSSAQTNPATSNPNLKNFFERRSDFNDAKSGDDYYVLVKFGQLPGKDQWQQLAEQQIRLLEYRSDNTYLAAVPQQIDQTTLAQFQVVEIVKPKVEDKLAEQLLTKDYPAWAVQEAGTADIAIVFFEKTPQSQIQSVLSNYNIQIIENKHRGNTTIVGRIAQSKIEALAGSPLVAYVDVIQEPVDILNHENRNIQRTNVVNSSVAGGYNLNGNGVVVGVGDGGELGDHIDFGSRVFNEANGTYSNFGNHGDHVSGIIAGNGNLNPRHRGMAPECNIITQKTSLITYYTEEYYNNYGMVLTNNSYGTSFNCPTNGTYNYSAQTLDWQMREFPEVLHVYAAGNSGGGTCDPYPQGYKTVLRFYQSAKNVLTVGNVGENRLIASGSSRGPVMDGRLKPEICGIGSSVISTGDNFNYVSKGGTSMAAPSVVGVLALMTEKYKLMHADQNPESGLLKAIACNTADDLGNTGPDYIYGFGLVNARRAIETLEDENYFINNMDNGDNHVYNISVPEDTRQLKLMLYWHDKEAGIYPEKALINDLDIELIAPDGTSYYPWILNTDPAHVADLATRGIDTLNNIEQITIDLPTAGDYTVIVSGSNVPYGNQRYFVTFENIIDEIVVTYPFGGESLVPGSMESVQWDTDPANTNTFKVEYSTDGGNSWQMIASAVEAHKRDVSWQVPQINADAVIVRVSKNGDSVYGESNMFFSVLASPQNFAVTTVCHGMLELSWDAVDDATGYQILMNTGDAMTVIGTTTENKYVVDEALQFGERYWFSVRARYQNNQFSERVAAQFGIPEDIDTCPWEDDPMIETIATATKGREKTQKSLANSEEVSVMVKNMGMNDISGFSLFYSINGGEPVEEVCNETLLSGDSLVYVFSQQADFSEGGVYDVDAWVNLSDDVHNFNDSIIGRHFVEQIPNQPVTLPFFEFFNAVEPKDYFENELGIAGARRWDFETEGFGKLSANSDGRLQINPTWFSQNTDLNNAAVLTLNMTNYNVDTEEIGLKFLYKTTPYPGTIGATELYNRVEIRGSDSDEWLSIFTLNPNQENLLKISGLNISELLTENGQEFSTSFQVRFSQNNVSALEIDEIAVYNLNDETQVSIPEILSFTSEKVGEDVILKWTTTVEPFDGIFEVQVADNFVHGNDDEFEVIGIVNGISTTTQPYIFIFNDTRPGKKGKKYYRLKQILQSGDITFSPVLMVDYDIPKSAVFPNPFSNELTVYLISNDETATVLSLTDSKGRTISQMTTPVQAGEQSITFQVDDNLPAGMYFLRIVSQGKSSFHKLFKR